MRKNGDLSLSLDNFLVALRQAGFRVGVVVDEAHHGLGHDTEAVRFYREIMQPDFTLLITATPDKFGRPIKQQLTDIGVNLTPLMLVQVANKGKDGNHAIDKENRVEPDQAFRVEHLGQY